jgi:hypothetical protein
MTSACTGRSCQQALQGDPAMRPPGLPVKTGHSPGIQTDEYIIAEGNRSFMEKVECEHENTYQLLFILGAIILVFSLYLNVYLLFRTVVLP